MFLDTNFLIATAQIGSAAALRIDNWIIAGEPLRISAMAWAEYLCGPVTTKEELQMTAIISSIHPINDRTARLGSQLFNVSGRRSRSLPDCLIAATAILEQEPLATLNIADFQYFVEFGLELA